MGNPGRDPRHPIPEMLLLDLRDFMQLRQNARPVMRNLELEDLAAGKLALTDRVDQFVDAATGEGGNVCDPERSEGPLIRHSGLARDPSPRASGERVARSAG